MPTAADRPTALKGARIWISIGGPAPVGPDDIHFLALDTTSPDTAAFSQADGGQRGQVLPAEF